MKNYALDIQNINLVDPGLWTIDKMFESKDFTEIVNEVLLVPDNLYTASVANPTTRFELTWTKDGILENLWETFKHTGSLISSVIGQPVKFGQIRVWKDTEGFRIPFHEDDQGSVAHIQIYLSGASEDIGTTWYTSTGRKSLPFVPNTGYLTVCKYRLPHGMLEPVTGKTRYSLYATFAKDA